MSNLLKFQNIRETGEEKRIIDSNCKVAERIQALLALENPEEFGGEGHEGFSGGLYPERVEMIETQAEQEAKRKQQEDYDAIVEQAKARADEIIFEASAKAVRIREVARAEGERSGYEGGYQKAVDDIEKMKEELDAKERVLMLDYKRQVDEIEPALVEIVADVFERVFHVQFDDKKSMVLHLVKNAMDKIENSREFIVRVPRENHAFVKERQDELQARVGKAVRVEVIEDMLLKKNQCVIETDSGVFDCSLDIQMDRLLKDLRSLSI